MRLPLLVIATALISVPVAIVACSSSETAARTDAGASTPTDSGAGSDTGGYPVDGGGNVDSGGGGTDAAPPTADGGFLLATVDGTPQTFPIAFVANSNPSNPYTVGVTGTTADMTRGLSVSTVTLGDGGYSCGIMTYSETLDGVLRLFGNNFDGGCSVTLTQVATDAGDAFEGTFEGTLGWNPAVGSADAGLYRQVTGGHFRSK